MNNLENFILEEKDINKVRAKLRDYHPYDLALEFQKLSKIGRMRLYEILDANEMADIFEYIEDKAPYVEEMYPSYTARLIDSMEVDDAADMLAELDEDKNHFLSMLSDESKKELETLISYDDDEAGSAMTTSFITIDANSDVKDAMRILFKESKEKEIIDPLFVVKDNKYVGELSLKDLIIARSPKAISDIMESSLTSIKDTDSLESASQMISDYGSYALAVTNDLQELVGVITMDDAIDIIEDESSEDYAKMASLGSDEDDTSIFKTLLKRTPWLLMLVFLSFVVSTVLSRYLTLISSISVLTFFQTLVSDMSGNSGTQSLAVTVRGISKGDFNERQTVFKHFFKELRVGFMNGMFLGIIAFGITAIFLFVRQTTDVNIFQVSFTISLSMMIAIMISDLVGAMMPLFLEKIHVDPAVASGPFISTISDILSIVIYFTLATLLLMGV